MPSLLPALPELFMAIAAMGLLVAGVFQKSEATRSVAWMTVGVLIFAALMVWGGTAGPITTFNMMFVVDSFGAFVKIMILGASALAVVMSLGFLEREKIERFEYPIVMLFATLGMMMMVSANDMISLYLGLELQSLALYVLAAYQRDSIRATEAGLKYFVLGSLASGLLLYGASLVYGFAGTTNFISLARIFHETHGHVHPGVIVGIVFILAGLAFKISAVPFHMWTPDVYEGAPTPVTAFFAVAPKIAAMALLIRLMVGPFGELTAQWRQVVILISAASMFIGAFAAIAQTNVKRLMAYSSIGHVGYALLGLAAGTQDGVYSVLVYFAIYLFMNVGAFAVILSMRRKGRMVEGIDDLAGLAKTNPMMALAMAIFMFSMAGIPPLAGFWGKLYVFRAAVDQGLITLSVIGVLTSVVGAFYYLRIIKVMYFDEPIEAFDRPVGPAMTAILAVNAAFLVFFTIVPAPLVASAQLAAKSLFPG
jgi:NADH-quinone oxidoreductase subunit N